MLHALLTIDREVTGWGTGVTLSLTERQLFRYKSSYVARNYILVQNTEYMIFVVYVCGHRNLPIDCIKLQHNM